MGHFLYYWTWRRRWVSCFEVLLMFATLVLQFIAITLFPWNCKHVYFSWYFVFFHLPGTSNLKRSFVFIVWQIEELWFNAHKFQKILHFAMEMGLIFKKIGWWLLFFWVRTSSIDGFHTCTQYWQELENIMNMHFSPR